MPEIAFGAERRRAVDMSIHPDWVRAVLGRARKVWMPLAGGKATIAGTPRAGWTLTCRAPPWRNATERVGYGWVTSRPDGSGRKIVQVGPRTRYEVRSRDAGRRVRCLAEAANAGGLDTTPVSKAMTVAE